MEVQSPQQPATTPPAAPATPSVETLAKPETTPEKQPEVETETPHKRESRRQRQLNRERNARIAAETELRLLKEQARPQPTDVASDEPRREQFNDYESFLEARAVYKAEKIAEEKARKIIEESRKSERESQTRSEREAQVKAWNAQIDKARDEVDDFDDVCSESDAVVTDHMSYAIMESDKGPFIAYYLAKNPQEAERISKLSPSKQAAAIVSLEDKVTRPAKQPSKAPEPINPVGQKAEVTKDPREMTDAEYAEWRHKRRAAKR